MWYANASKPYAPDWVLKVPDFENPRWQVFIKFSKLVWCTFRGRVKGYFTGLLPTSVIVRNT